MCAPDKLRPEVQKFSHSFSESCCCYIPANSFATHILFDRGTGLPGKVSVIKTIVCLQSLLKSPQ